jgi:hypothetical protein
MDKRAEKRFAREHRRRAMYANSAGAGKIEQKTEEGKAGFVYQGTFPMVVLRPKPEDVPRKLAKAEEIIGRQNRGELTGKEASVLLDAFANELPHEFLGYLCADQRSVLNGAGVKISDLLPGDSLSSGPAFAPPGAKLPPRHLAAACDECGAVFHCDATTVPEINVAIDAAGWKREGNYVACTHCLNVTRRSAPSSQSQQPNGVIN